MTAQDTRLDRLCKRGSGSKWNGRPSSANGCDHHESRAGVACHTVDSCDEATAARTRQLHSNRSTIGGGVGPPVR